MIRTHKARTGLRAGALLAVSALALTACGGSGNGGEATAGGGEGTEAKRVGIVYSSGEVNSEVQVEWAKEAAGELGMEIVEATVSNSSEVQQAANSLDVDAFYVPTDNAVVSALESLLGVAQNQKIPVIAAEGDSVERGAVATYGLNYEKLGAQTAEMAVRILTEDADPATMPVETPTELELYVNPKAAEAMGVEIPQSMLDEADHTVGE